MACLQSLYWSPVHPNFNRWRAYRVYTVQQSTHPSVDGMLSEFILVSSFFSLISSLSVSISLSLSLVRSLSLCLSLCRLYLSHFLSDSHTLCISNALSTAGILYVSSTLPLTLHFLSLSPVSLLPPESLALSHSIYQHPYISYDVHACILTYMHAYKHKIHPTMEVRSPYVH